MNGGLADRATPERCSYVPHCSENTGDSGGVCCLLLSPKKVHVRRFKALERGGSPFPRREMGVGDNEPRGKGRSASFPWKHEGEMAGSWHQELGAEPVPRTCRTRSRPQPLSGSPCVCQTSVEVPPRAQALCRPQGGSSGGGRRRQTRPSWSSRGRESRRATYFMGRSTSAVRNASLEASSEGMGVGDGGPLGGQLARCREEVTADT